MVRQSVVLRIATRLKGLLAPPAGTLVPLRAAGATAGYLTLDRAQRLARYDAFRLHEGVLHAAVGLAREVDGIVRELAREGALTAWRDERYAARGNFDAPPWFTIERAAARYFGIHTYAAHVNGLARHGDRILMWIARRSAAKSIDPGMLDNLVGGGIPDGASVAGTVVKESLEEAGIDASIARGAVRAPELTIFRAQPDGIQHETVYPHDLWLPRDFVPVNQDGEAGEHRLLDLDQVALVLAGDSMTADASLVAFDCLVRLGAIADRPEFAPLRTATIPAR